MPHFTSSEERSGGGMLYISDALCLGFAVTLINALGFWPGSVPQLQCMYSVNSFAG